MYIALIPAYQPEDTLLDLLDKAAEQCFRIVVVDDGSDESCQDIFRHAETYGKVLHHARNKGKGAALKTGLDYIEETFDPEDIVITLDADGQHTIEDAKKLCQLAAEHPGELLLGSRDLDTNVPLRSKMGNTITRWVYRLTTGVSVHDTQTGMRAFHVEEIPELLTIRGDRYEYEMNMLLECPRRGIPIREMTIETIYLNDNASSHFDTVRDSIRIYKEILKFGASSFASFLVDYGLFGMFSILTSNLTMVNGLALSNVAARLISGTVNYSINRNLVFKSKAGIRRSAASYILLASCILAGNTVVLSFLVNNLGVNTFLAKIVTECIFFLISWSVQRSMIFRKRDDKIEEEENHKSPKFDREFSKTGLVNPSTGRNLIEEV